MSSWKKRVVVPLLRRLDDDWFKQQYEKLMPTDRVRYASRIFNRIAFSPGLLWAPSGGTTWRCYQTWCAVRVSGGLPLSLWGSGSLVFTLQYCPLCGALDVGLEHVLVECPGTLQFRQKMPAWVQAPMVQWCLCADGGADTLYAKLHHVGLSVAAVGRCGNGSGPAW